MDRYYRKEDRHKITKLKIAIGNPSVNGGITALVLFLFFIIATCGNIQAAEKDRKIELEKEEIIGVLERPNVIFPIRWKDPEVQNEKEYKLQRGFKEEIFDFVDMETINNTSKGRK